MFRSFLPLLNPIGFGAGDFLELGLALLLVVAIFVWRPLLEPHALRLAEKTGWCMLLLALLPIALRLALLPHHPIPTPDLYDEFGHLLEADTLRHFRLANPAHPMHRFFETFFVLQEPTYSSIYPMGQGLMLAFGWTLFGLPWAGVILATAALCALCYWMLRAWTTPGWALAGGVLAAIEFGPLNQWMNNYWGGAFTAAAGCLVFGALPRLRERGRTRDALLLGLGLALNLITRPYESVFLVLAVALYFVRDARVLVRALPAVCAMVLPALGMTLWQNRAVTGRWTTMPYVLSQYQYGVPAGLTFQPDPAPHRQLTREQDLDYKMQAGFHSGPETPGSYLVRLEYRVRYYRFFFLVPLYLALVAFLFTLRDWRLAWAAGSVLLFALGINFFPAFQFHYLAAVTCLFVLIAVAGMQRLSRLSVEAGRLVYFLCVAHFVLWYGVHLGEGPLRPFETWSGINHRSNAERRMAVANQVAALSGKQLIFVHYTAQHVFQDEWVYNRADIDASRVVWARDLGPEEDLKLCQYYPDRQVWLLEPDVKPPRLTAYRPEPAKVESVHTETPPAESPPAESPKAEPKKAPLIVMEDVK